MTISGKHCGKRRNCSFWSISSLLLCFQTAVCCRCVRKRLYDGKGWTVTINISSFYCPCFADQHHRFTRFVLTFIYFVWTLMFRERIMTHLYQMTLKYIMAKVEIADFLFCQNVFNSILFYVVCCKFVVCGKGWHLNTLWQKKKLLISCFVKMFSTLFFSMSSAANWFEMI